MAEMDEEYTDYVDNSPELNEGLYEYSEDDFRTAVQNCSICDTKTTKRCEKCDWKYYCSRACQIKDWPQHQAECGSIPALVDVSLEINQDVNEIKTLTSNVETAKSPEAERRKILDDTFNVSQETSSNTNNSNNTTINEQLTKNTEVTHSDADVIIISVQSSNNECSNHNRNYKGDSNKTSLKESHENNSNVRDKICNNDRNVFQNNKGSTSYNDRENTNSQTVTSSVNDFSYKDTYLSNKEFTTVEVIKSLGNDQYWVFKLEDIDIRTNLMTMLQDVKNSSNMTPIIGELYGVEYEDLWYRAMVTALNPTKVQFVDFGDYEITLKKDAELKDLGYLIKSPILATKIRLPQGISDKYRNLQRRDEISVKMLFVDSEKYTLVEIKEEQFAEKKKFAAD